MALNGPDGFSVRVATPADAALHAPGCTGKITALVVAEAWQRQGVGALLVAAAETWATARGARRFEVVSGNQRLEAHRFYLRLGYRAAGQLRFTKDA